MRRRCCGATATARWASSTGSAMYHVGIAYASSYSDCEVPVLSAGL